MKSDVSKKRVPLEDIFRARISDGVWKPNDKLPKEKELAIEFGVCAATVQRHLHVLQREGLIWSQRGRGRFVASAGHRPRTGVIGVVLRDSSRLRHPVISDTIAGIGDTLTEKHLNMNILAVNIKGVGKAIDALPLLSAGSPNGVLSLPTMGHVDGLILLVTLEPDVLKRVASFMPIVTTYATEVPGVPSVVMDLAAGAHLAIQHLSELGHTRIAVVTQAPADTIGQAVRTGVRLSALQLGLPDGALRVITIKQKTEEEGLRIARLILDEQPRATAVLCMDQIADPVLRACETTGVRIPDDLSFMSWNRVHTERRPVGITSVCYDDYALGVRRAVRLLELIEHPGKNGEEQEFAAPFLVERASTAPPPR